MKEMSSRRGIHKSYGKDKVIVQKVMMSILRARDSKSPFDFTDHDRSHEGGKKNEI